MTRRPLKQHHLDFLVTAHVKRVKFLSFSMSKDEYKEKLQEQINALLGKKAEKEQINALPGKKAEKDSSENKQQDMTWVRVLPTAIEKTGPDFLQVVTADDTFDRAPLALRAGSRYQLQVLSQYAFEMFKEITDEICNLQRKLDGINNQINGYMRTLNKRASQVTQQATPGMWQACSNEDRKKVMQELRKRDQRIQCLKEMEELMTQFRRLRIHKLRQRKSLDDSVDQAMPVQLVNKFCKFVFPFPSDENGAKADDAKIDSETKADEVKLDPETKVQFEMTRRWSGLNTSRERAEPEEDKDDLEEWLNKNMASTTGDEKRVLERFLKVVQKMQELRGVVKEKPESPKESGRRKSSIIKKGVISDKL